MEARGRALGIMTRLSIVGRLVELQGGALTTEAPTGKSGRPDRCPAGRLLPRPAGGRAEPGPAPSDEPTYWRTARRGSVEETPTAETLFLYLQQTRRPVDAVLAELRWMLCA